MDFLDKIGCLGKKKPYSVVRSRLLHLLQVLSFFIVAISLTVFSDVIDDARHRDTIRTYGLVLIVVLLALVLGEYIWVELQFMASYWCGRKFFIGTDPASGYYAQFGKTQWHCLCCAVSTYCKERKRKREKRKRREREGKRESERESKKDYAVKIDGYPLSLLPTNSDPSLIRYELNKEDSNNRVKPGKLLKWLQTDGEPLVYTGSCCWLPLFEIAHLLSLLAVIAYYITFFIFFVQGIENHHDSEISHSSTDI